MPRNLHAPILVVLFLVILPVALLRAVTDAEEMYAPKALVIAGEKKAGGARVIQAPAKVGSLREVISIIAADQSVEIRSLVVAPQSPLDGRSAIFAIDAEASAPYASAKAWIAEVAGKARGVGVGHLSFTTSGTEPTVSIRVRFTAVAKP